MTFSRTSIKEIVIKQSDRKCEYFKHVNFIVLVCKFIVQFNFQTNPFSLDSHIFRNILSHRCLLCSIFSHVKKSLNILNFICTFPKILSLASIFQALDIYENNDSYCIIAVLAVLHIHNYSLSLSVDTAVILCLGFLA